MPGIIVSLLRTAPSHKVGSGIHLSEAKSSSLRDHPETQTETATGGAHSHSPHTAGTVPIASRSAVSVVGD